MKFDTWLKASVCERARGFLAWQLFVRLVLAAACGPVEAKTMGDVVRAASGTVEDEMVRDVLGATDVQKNDETVDDD